MKTTLIDRIGELRAAMAPLAEELKALETEAKALGPGRLEGELFEAVVSEVDSKRVDWKAVAAKLEPSRQLVQAHTKTSTSVRLGPVTARKKEAA